MPIHHRRKYRRNRTQVLSESFLSIEEQAIRQIKQHWLARALLFCNGIPLYLKDHFRNDDILNFIELDENTLEDLKKPEIKKILKNHCESLIDTEPSRRGEIFNNLAKVSQHFSLNEIEEETMLFALLIDLDNTFSECFDLFGELTNRSLFSHLSRILDIPEKQVCNALQRSQLLSNSGLLKVDSDSRSMDQKFDVLKGLSSALDGLQPDISSIFANFITEAPTPTLTPCHFNHIKADYDRLSLYLHNICHKNITGGNILIYGPPGTGKTQLVRVLSKQLNLSLNEISVEDQDGDILSSKERVTACQLAQKILEKSPKQCLLFDEIEDLFEGDIFSSFIGRSRSSSKVVKGWFNQLLENNAVPTFWLSNNITDMDKAFLRRFDLVMELSIPPRSTREQILTESLQHTDVSKTWVENMAQLEQLPPAVISRAARVSDIIGESSPDKVEAHLENIIGNTLKAMGHKYQVSNSHTTHFYDPSLINTSAPLNKITNGLNTSGSGRLCLFGPPGTGKSAYAKYLAKTLDKPLIAKRASDIIDCYVGGTEKNIARMFAGAKAEQGVLLLDEADSFLRDRTNSRHSWETTQVNELLVQMENFEGIFICSTNLMNNLDAAALRRFDFKLEFTYLKPEQAWKLLKGFIGDALNKLSPRKKGFFKNQLIAIPQLTPGDFAAVQRKLTVLGEKNNISLFIESLTDEVSFKTDKPNRSIGFSAEF